MADNHIRSKPFTLQTAAGFSDRDPVGYGGVEFTEIIVRLASAWARHVVDNANSLEQHICPLR